MLGYSRLDRLLHRLALHGASLAELSFDLDQMTVRADLDPVRAGHHVFVAGLARAGTTILMRRLHETGAFRSLTYRDMPFVLAPNLWRRLQRQRPADTPRERAHGDGIGVNIDSPESLDEVFWRVFCADAYIRGDGLIPHVPPQDILDKFAGYVHAILRSDAGGRDRYLSKNNNNILRIGALRSTFPNAQILVPFRAPLAHAASLLRQHQRFGAMQDRHPFVRSYMGWLAHHEFGNDHRPMRVPHDRADAVTAASDRAPDGIDYWLALWCRTYAWLLETAPQDVLFVCYEDLCRSPQAWHRLAAITRVAPGVTTEPFRLAASGDRDEADPRLVQRSRDIYDALASLSRATVFGDRRP